MAFSCNGDSVIFAGDSSVDVKNVREIVHRFPTYGEVTSEVDFEINWGRLEL